MNLVLACPRYPPSASKRLTDQRRGLAVGLARLGHQVHLLHPALPAKSGGESERSESVTLTQIPPPPRINEYSAAMPALDYPLSYSQVLHECVLRLEETFAVDVLDVPLEGATGLVSLAHHAGPVVVRIDEPSDDDRCDPAEALLEECVQRAAGILASSSAALERARRMGAHCGEGLMKVVPLTGDESAARTHADLYASVLRQASQRRGPAVRRVLQLMDALDYGDAVGSLALRNAECLAEVGGEQTILTVHAHPLVADHRAAFDATQLDAGDALLVHYWGFSELEGFLRAFRGPKAVHYHNMTPPGYFSPDSRDFEMTSQGYEQLARMAGWFDLVIGDSEFNLDEYALHLSRPKPTLCLYPTVEASSILSQRADEALLQKLGGSSRTTFLFVGRIARNKRQDRVMELFDYYYREVDRNSRLFLVGSFDQNRDYRLELEALRQTLRSGEHIVLTGKVPDDAVRAYYRAADVYVSASEHEGFGVPLIEAMAYGVPVLALARTAVTEAMGSAGVLARAWDVPRIAEQLAALLSDPDAREAVLDGQRRNLARFSREEARHRLAQAVDFLRTGTVGPLMVWRGGAGE